MGVLADLITGTSGLVSFWEGTDAVGSTSITDVRGGHTATLALNPKTGMPGIGHVAQSAWKCFGNTADEGATITNHADFNTLVHSFETCILFPQHIRGVNTGVWGKGVTGMPYLFLSETASSITPQIRSGFSVITTGTGSITDTYLWHHLAFTVNSTYDTIKLYLDGSDITGSLTNVALATGTDDAALGSLYQPMLLANSAFYNVVLSASDINERWNALRDERRSTSTPVYFGIHSDAMFNATAGEIDSHIATAASVKAAFSRNTLKWNVVQSTSASSYDWSRADELVRICNEDNVAPWFFIGGTPTWANGGTDVYDIPGVGVDATFQAWVAKLVTFVGAFVDRFRPGGTGTYTIDSELGFWIEIWNEPNLDSFWNNLSVNTNQQRADQYAYMYNQVRNKILTQYVDAKVVMAGLSSWSAAGAPDIVGETFFRNVVGSSSWSSATLDYLGYHPYSTSDNADDVVAFENHFNDVLPIRHVLAELGYPNTKIALTEFGVSVAGGEAAQATTMNTMLSRIRDEWSLFVPVAIWFCDSDETFANYGIFQDMPSDGSVSTTPRAAAAVFETFGLDTNPATEPTLLLTPVGARTLLLTPKGGVIVVSDDGFYTSAVTYPGDGQYPGVAYSASIGPPTLTLTPA